MARKCPFRMATFRSKAAIRFAASPREGINATRYDTRTHQMSGEPRRERGWGRRSRRRDGLQRSRASRFPRWDMPRVISFGRGSEPSSSADVEPVPSTSGTCSVAHETKASLELCARRTCPFSRHRCAASRSAPSTAGPGSPRCDRCSSLSVVSSEASISTVAVEALDEARARGRSAGGPRRASARVSSTRPRSSAATSPVRAGCPAAAWARAAASRRRGVVVTASMDTCPPVDAVDPAVDHEARGAACRGRSVLLERSSRASKRSRLAPRANNAASFPAASSCGSSRLNLRAVAEELPRVARRRIPQRDAEQVVDVDLDDRGSPERGGVESLHLPPACSSEPASR
jgi:hypothetical protein